MNTSILEQLESGMQQVMLSDRHRLQKQLRGIQRALDQGEPVAARLERLRQAIDRSCELRQRREKNVPPLAFDPELPITAKRQEIASAIAQSQVVVVCGETGSGKSTQLPKICLGVGRGVSGFIGHTQPRRIAARSVAARLADELGSSVGGHVGFKIRFADTVRPASYVKLMTDGILLAETQQDRFLEQYDTLIIDEAHERSLNIDFLLGYVKRLLPQRRELRLIITSATIDAARFAEHFSDQRRPVPVIEVSGRGHPIETRYQPAEPDEEGGEADPSRSLVEAVVQVCREGPGDVLVFLPTEREIRDTAKMLRGWSLGQSSPPEILPLYARLPLAQQQQIFQPGRRRRIVLATNVAESSLTVPGIRYVVDTGTARISRYSPRSKVQRLPIEPISQAAADQRRGRCGRTGPGICVRLYGEADYLSRDRYTTPEIRRTNLAGVILQTLALRLGHVEQFPFLDPPRGEAIRDGYKTLFELGAIEAHRRLTDIGRRMSRMPVDPRIARMILAGADEQCLAEILIIASALEIQDPRERPAEKEQQADARHAQFADERSDFTAYLRLWDFFHRLKENLSRSQLRKACQQNFLSLTRLREWQDVHRQLHRLVQESGLRAAAWGGFVSSQDAARRSVGTDFTLDRYDAIHRALLTGLLSNIALRGDRNEYQSAGGTKSYLWPGSGVFSKKPKWVVAAEVVETHRRYLRTVAEIDAGWIEPLAEHLVKRSYREPHWSRKRSSVLATERVTLFGLPIVVGRPVPYGKIDPQAARQLFIQQALVEGDFDSRVDFFQSNRRLIDELRGLAAKARRSDYLVADAVQYCFYHERLPDGVYDAATLEGWLRRAPPGQVQALSMMREDLVPEAAAAPPGDFPDRLETGPLTLDASYHFQPGEEDDGVSVTVPQQALRQLDAERLEWLVPGLLEEKVLALIRCLPKSIRRNLVPAADSARRAAAMLEFGKGRFLEALAAALSEIAEEPVPAEAFQLERLPPHLQVNVRVVDEKGKTVAQGRDPTELSRRLNPADSTPSLLLQESGWHRDGITQWDFGELPECIQLERGGIRMLAYPALIDRGRRVGLQLLDTEPLARRATRGGLRRLFVLAEQRELKSQVHWLPRLDEVELWASTWPYNRDLRGQLAELLADLAFVHDRPVPRSADEFIAARKAGRQRLPVAVQDVARLIVPLFEAYHEARLKLDQTQSAACREAAADAGRQLDELMIERFLVETPWSWLAHLPRYLQGIALRLEKLKTSGPQRDAQLMLQVEPLAAAYHERRQLHRQRGTVDPQLEEFRWLLEEFRISLFAQQLGTSVKVSPQRLAKQWAKVEA